MPTYRLPDNAKVCIDPQHIPNQQLEPGAWEHVCPCCEAVITFRVTRVGLARAQPAPVNRAHRCTACGGCGRVDSGYNGWFASPDTTCDVCGGTGVIQ